MELPGELTAVNGQPVVKLHETLMEASGQHRVGLYHAKPQLARAGQPVDEGVGLPEREVRRGRKGSLAQAVLGGGGGVAGEQGRACDPQEGRCATKPSH